MDAYRVPHPLPYWKDHNTTPIYNRGFAEQRGTPSVHPFHSFQFLKQGKNFLCHTQGTIQSFILQAMIRIDAFVSIHFPKAKLLKLQMLAQKTQ